MRAALRQRPAETAYKRLEKDKEYRMRVIRAPTCVGLLYNDALACSGVALDKIGEQCDCLRRIVEVGL